MKKHTVPAKLWSWLLALVMILSLVPGMGMTAYADNTETLLTTITATGDRQASYSTANVATVSFSYTAGGSSAYLANWGWWGYGWSATVNAAEGYTITKCVFYDDANRTATDSSSPFVVETTEEDKTPQVNGTPILAYTSKGIKKIEVYGYQTPSSAYADYLPAATDDATALAAKVVKFNGYDWYLIEDNSTSETEGTVTLFAKDTIGSSRFDNSNNVYSGSMVKSYLDKLTAEGGAFADVADAIVSTDLEDVTVTGAKLWLLSKDEVITTYKLSTALNKCSNDWWLRTPATSSYLIYVNGESGSVVNSGNFHMNTYGVRPALQLDLSKVEFNSETNTFAVPTPHEHDFTYSANGATITATCNGAGTCSLTDNKVSFTLTAPTSLVYDGTDKKATLEGVDAFNAATGLNVSANDIIYNDLTNVVTETKNAGTYQALYTLQTDFPRPFVGITFTVAKANPTANDFMFSEPDNLNYNGNNKTATVIPQAGVDGMGDATVKYYSDAARTNEVDYAKNAGTYYVGITVNEGDNYNAASAVLYVSSWKFTVAKASPTANGFMFSEPDNLNYNGNNKTATVIPQDGVNGMGNATVKYFSDAARTNEVDYAKNAGTYYVGVTVNEGDNYNAASVVLYDSSWKFTVAKANPTYSAPTGLTATYGDTLSGVTLPTGWAWANNTQSVGNVGTNTFKANFTPADTANYNTVSGVDVTVTVGKAAGKAAVVSTDTMSYSDDSIYIEGVAGQEYIIVPKGTKVTDADWNNSVKPDPERDNWVFFENLKEATEFEIYARTAETETAFASDAVKANVYTTLSSIGYLYDSTLVGASITVEPEPETEGLTYKWYQDEVTEDDEGALHHALTEIPGATGPSYTFRTEDVGKHIAVKIFAGDSEVGDVVTGGPVAATGTVIFESMGGSEIEPLTGIAYQGKVDAPADPVRQGYAFEGWYLWYYEGEYDEPWDFDKNTVMWTETTLYAKWTSVDYNITSVTGLTGSGEDQWTKGGKDGAVITVKLTGAEDDSFERFVGVKLDGKELVRDVDYTVAKGSTVVTLKPETLEKLSVGKHTVTILFNNGQVDTTLTVLELNAPQTGDSSLLTLWMAMAALSPLAIAALLVYGKKKKTYAK